MTTDINASGSLPTDDEMDLLTDYLGGCLSEEDHQAFDRRLEEDEEFFYRMAPLLDFWYSPDMLPAEMETLRELRADRPAVEPAAHSGFGRAAAWWHRQWVQLGTLAAASVVLVGTLISALSSPQVMPMTATLAIHRPAVTPHQAVAVAVVPKPATHGRRIVAQRTVSEPQISDRAIEDALVASITRALPEARSAAVGAVPGADAQAMPITAVVVSSQLPDGTAQNAEERARDLAAPKVPSGAGVVSRSWWQKIKDKVRGSHPPVMSKF